MAFLTYPAERQGGGGANRDPKRVDRFLSRDRFGTSSHLTCGQCRARWIAETWLGRRHRCMHALALAGSAQVTQKTVPARSIPTTSGNSPLSPLYVADWRHFDVFL